MKVTAVIVAGGSGSRMRAGQNKVFLSICGKEMIYYTLSAFEKNTKTDEIVLVVSKNDIERARKIVKTYNFHKVITVTEGGATRQESVMNGLKKAKGDIVLIHDGARAMISDDEINASVDDCLKYGASAVGVKCKDTMKIVDDKGFICETVDREFTYSIQTPQTFYLNEILDLHKKAHDEGFCATDDCMIAERYGLNIKITNGSYDNIKLTTPEDMAIAEQILKRRGVTECE